MKRSPVKKISGLVMLLAVTRVFAAEPVDLSHLPLSSLSAFSMKSAGGLSSSFREKSVHVDRNHMAHIRLQQTVAGYPVWRGDAILHVPESTFRQKGVLSLLAHPVKDIRVNGTAWRHLEADLQRLPATLFSDDGSQKALQAALTHYQHKTGTRPAIADESIQRIVFVDDDNKAHWAWHIEFTARVPHQSLARPAFLLDAMNFRIYQQWNNLKTENALASGFGGNPQTGQLTYDGLPSHLPALQISRNDTTKSCTLQNSEVTVIDRDETRGDQLSTFECPVADDTHLRTYWDGNFNATNGAWSPDNDALFIGHVIQQFFYDWYAIPPLSRKGKPMTLVMRVHDYELPNNAFWDGKQMTFSDGGEDFYPFTILSIGAHEISHGFTEQHSDLIYNEQSGGLNESFSDMAGAAADFYVWGTNHWGIGAEISKSGEGPFRFMDQPSKDCHGRHPGLRCSIDRASQYHCTHDQEGNKYCLDVHYSSGVFNRAFYLLATSPGWDTHKAFDVMVKANQDYWVPATNFQEAACGIMHAGTDLQYDTATIRKVLAEVDLDTSLCQESPG